MLCLPVRVCQRILQVNVRDVLLDSVRMLELDAHPLSALVPEEHVRVPLVDLRGHFLHPPKFSHALLVGAKIGVGVVPPDGSLLVRRSIFAKVLGELRLRLQKSLVVVLVDTQGWRHIYYFPLLLH